MMIFYGKDIASNEKMIYLCSGFGFPKTDNFFEAFMKKVFQNGQLSDYQRRFTKKKNTANGN